MLIIFSKPILIQLQIVNPWTFYIAVVMSCLLVEQDIFLVSCGWKKSLEKERSLQRMLMNSADVLCSQDETMLNATKVHAP